MKNRILLPVILVLAACNSETSVKTETTKTTTKQVVALSTEQLHGAEIKEAYPKEELIGLSIHANGTIDVPPQNKTVITAEFGGFVKSLNVLDGMHVSKGQTLLTIEHPELIQLQQDYLEVIGNLDYLKAEVERQEKLVAQEAGSIKNLQLATSQLNIGLAKKKGMSAKLDMAGVQMKQLESGKIQRSIAILAPFNGVVTKVAVDVGAYAAPTDKLLEIIDLKHSHAEVIVFEKDVKHLRLGQKVELSFSGEYEDIDAEVFLIGKEIGKDRTVKVHCHLDQENATIAPGSYFKATIYTGQNKRFCVPSDAIVDFNGKDVVFVNIGMKNGKTLFVPEEVSVIAIENGLAAFAYKNKSRSLQDKLVVHGAYDIMSCLLVSDEE